jgi:hypothetical protein
MLRGQAQGTGRPHPEDRHVVAAVDPGSGELGAKGDRPLIANVGVEGKVGVGEGADGRARQARGWVADPSDHRQRPGGRHAVERRADGLAGGLVEQGDRRQGHARGVDAQDPSGAQQRVVADTRGRLTIQIDQARRTLRVGEEQADRVACEAPRIVGAGDVPHIPKMPGVRLERLPHHHVGEGRRPPHAGHWAAHPGDPGVAAAFVAGQAGPGAEGVGQQRSTGVGEAEAADRTPRPTGVDGGRARLVVFPEDRRAARRDQDRDRKPTREAEQDRAAAIEQTTGDHARGHDVEDTLGNGRVRLQDQPHRAVGLPHVGPLLETTAVIGLPQDQHSPRAVDHWRLEVLKRRTLWRQVTNRHQSFKSDLGFCALRSQHPQHGEYSCASRIHRSGIISRLRVCR